MSSTTRNHPQRLLSVQPKKSLHLHQIAEEVQVLKQSDFEDVRRRIMQTITKKKAPLHKINPRSPARDSKRAKAFSPNARCMMADGSFFEKRQRKAKLVVPRKINVIKLLEGVNTKVEELAKTRVLEAKQGRFRPLKFLQKVNRKFGYRLNSPKLRNLSPIIKPKEEPQKARRFLKVLSKDESPESSPVFPPRTTKNRRLSKSAGANAMLDKIFRIGLEKYKHRVNIHL